MSLARRVLIELIGFQHTFLVTAAIKMLSFVPLLALLFLLDEGTPCCRPWGKRAMAAGVDAPTAANSDADPLQAPLLVGVEPDQARNADGMPTAARAASTVQSA